MNNKRILFFCLIALAMLAAACVPLDPQMAATDEQATSDEQANSDSDMPQYSLTQIWEAEGFSEPEAVFTFPGHPWIYVSNPNGEEPGYVSRIARDGTIDAIRWVEGFTLPTGMDEYDGDLYVVDLTRVVQIDLDTGQIVKEHLSDIDAEGNGPNGTPVILNDVSVRSDGIMFVTAIGAGIYTPNDEGILVAWSSLLPEAGLIPVPNGIQAADDALYVGNMAESFEAMQKGEFGPVLKVSYADGSLEPIVGEDGPFAAWDGLDFFANGMIGTSPPTGEIWYMADGGGVLVGNVGVENQISDTGIDPDEGILYAPMLLTNKVIAYKLEGFE